MWHHTNDRPDIFDLTYEHEYLSNELATEKDHSEFLEKLLRALWGEGWEHLTVYDAEEWHKKFFKK